MKKIVTVLALLLTATLISGCSGNVPVKITNDLGAWNIEEVLIDLSENPWGENLLTETLTPGDDETFMVAPGTYDIMLIDEDGDEYTRWEVEIGSGGYDWAVTLEDMN